MNQAVQPPFTDYERVWCVFFFHWEIGNQLLSPLPILAFPPSYIFFHFCPPPSFPYNQRVRTFGKSILPFFLPISYFSLPPPYFGSPLPCTERMGSVLLFLLSLFIPIYHHIPCFSFTESKNLFPLFLPFFSFSFFLSFFHFCLPFPYSGGHLPCGDWASRSPGFCHPALYVLHVFGQILPPHKRGYGCQRGPSLWTANNEMRGQPLILITV